jgi:uncharacterized protein
LTSDSQPQPTHDGTDRRRGLSARPHLTRVVASPTTRTCIGCRGTDIRENMLRLVLTTEQTIAFDFAGCFSGRGAWVHARGECLSKSAKGLTQAFRSPVFMSAASIHQSVVASAWQRVEALARSAKRAGNLTTDAEAIAAAWASKKVAIAIIAEDASVPAMMSSVLDAQKAGRTIVGPTQSILGRWLGRGRVAVAAITDPGLAKAIARAIAVAKIPDLTQNWRAFARGTEVG